MRRVVILLAVKHTRERLKERVGSTSEIRSPPASRLDEPARCCTVREGWVVDLGLEDGNVARSRTTGGSSREGIDLKQWHRSSSGRGIVGIAILAVAGSPSGARSWGSPDDRSRDARHAGALSSTATAASRCAMRRRRSPSSRRHARGGRACGGPSGHCAADEGKTAYVATQEARAIAPTPGRTGRCCL